MRKKYKILHAIILLYSLINFFIWHVDTSKNTT